VQTRNISAETLLLRTKPKGRSEMMMMISDRKRSSYRDEGGLVASTRLKNCFMTHNNGL
jgi:hypothetical protein